MLSVLVSVIFAMIIIVTFSGNLYIHATPIDVKCTVYEHSDDVNGNNVDVRILVMGLKANNDYTAKVTPDHNPPKAATTKSDSDGVFWIVVKIPNGEKSMLFDVNVHEGNNANGSLIATGSDDAPCTNIVPPIV